MQAIYTAIGLMCLYIVPLTQSQWTHPDWTAPRQEVVACRTPLNDLGQCVSLKKCPEVLELFKRVPFNQATEYSRELNRRCFSRNTEDNYPIVCCTHASATTTASSVPVSVTQPVVTTTPRTVPASTTEWIDLVLKITGEPCVGPNAERGYCRPLANCTQLLEPLQQNTRNETLKAYIRASHDKCGFADTDVCCPSSAATRSTSPGQSSGAMVSMPTEEDGCGISQQPLKKIVGGEDSAPGRWPWAVLLGYNIREAQTFRCGGTLITAKHVVTAAHCLEDSLSFVRLGEFDLTSETDSSHVDISIEKVVGHPDFRRLRDKRHDVAVVYLERTVQFTDLIVPICLPRKDLRTKSYIDHTPFLVGWGKTQVGGKGSNVLQELQIVVFNNSVCQNAYKLRNKFVRDEQFDETVLCAGNLAGGKDSCQGDSGGPLMMPEYYKGYTVHYYLIGVVSYGIGCGLPGVPGIYTSVQHFMDWIEARVAETGHALVQQFDNVRQADNIVGIALRIVNRVVVVPTDFVLDFLECCDRSNMKLLIFIATLTCIATPALAQQPNRRQVRQNCVTPENYYGNCVGLSYCPQVANIFEVANRQVAERYVLALQRNCGTRSVNGDPLVCCTRPSNPVTQRPNPFFPTERPFVNPTRNPNRNPFLPDRPSPTQVIPTTAPNRNPFLPDLPPSTTTTTTRRTTTTTTTRAPITSAPLVEARGPFCRGPDTRAGECVDIRSCDTLLDELRLKQTDPNFAKFLQASNRVCGGAGSTVCCPTGEVAPTSAPGMRPRNTNEIPRRLLTVEEGCGYTLNSYKKIVGGEVSKKGAWPWIALLGYDDGSGSPFKCGGTLITARHIVTAAHCIRPDLTFVRLGEHDLGTDTEARHVDINVARYESHPEYNRRNGRSDIALLYLERNVEFTDSIAPICMPNTPQLRQKSYVNYMPFVVGWGKTMEGGESAQVLQELQIPIYPNEVCRSSYEKAQRLFTADQFDAAIVCAGVLTGGKDTCQGDSGGPLMIPEEFQNGVRFYLIGVVSYGIGCARPDVPGVYTSTQYFIDWITEKVQNTQ
ncbi:uncharacterized protein LOC115628430 [Scaptodrosophila lebanonensis]|uniref:Uncharacterized protein LOC115628430 n=1 Tax=Drosophila lebanonensis TaxID=7225 RepID=A0A6J2TYZ1_DROLE|nr:uncharacterized protein LOC115628430 [Scaptodrosophila lebanonensis]